MNELQMNEIKRRARLESNTELNENKMVFALVKNGTSLGKITTDEQLVSVFVENCNFSICAIYVNGEQKKVSEYTRLSCR